MYLLLLFLFHCFGLLAWKDHNPKDIAVIRSVAEAVAGAMSEGGVVYTPVRIIDNGPTAGTFVDW